MTDDLHATQYAKGMYSTISYFLAKNLAEFPFQRT